MNSRIEGWLANALLLACCMLAAGPAAAETLILLESPDPYELESVGFELAEDAEVEVEAVGRWARGRGGFWDWWNRDDEGSALSVYAWILDAATRRPVWTLEPDTSEALDRNLREASTSLRLPAGRYELYFLSRHDPRYTVERSDDDSWWDRMWRGEGGDRDLGEDLDACHVRLSADARTARELRKFEVTGDLPGALLALNRVGHSRLARAGFELSRPARLRLYGMTERSQRSRQASDYGWIVDHATGERVWDSSRSRLDPAGGSRKNRLIDEEIELDAGRYVLHYGTDDSHSFERFNANPPHDPYNWGVTLLAEAGFDRAAFSTFEPRAAPPLIEFARAGDEAFFEQPFRLGRQTTLSVQALGEYDDDDDEFVDRAWITSVADREIVWEMTGRNTFAAGGADKNRMFVGPVSLAAGDYVLFYAADGSHSYESWNAAAPFEPQAWGVAIRPGPGFSAGDLTLLDEREVTGAGEVLARLVRIGDRERERIEFTLDRRGSVHVYALGEGDSDGMYDYASIVDARSGDTVWEMTYRETRHAGGARKNRMFDGELVLEAGSYTLVYQSDGSHSFDGWNASAPRDPASWGVTVHRVDR